LAYNADAAGIPSHVPQTDSIKWTGIVATAAKAVMQEQENKERDLPARRWAERSQMFFELAKQRNLMPNTPYSGRTESVAAEKQTSLATAWTRINRTMRMNNVKYELRMQEHFEKPGEKRRRLRSERWRRRFAEEVRRKIQLANAIRRRGA